MTGTTTTTDDDDGDNGPMCVPDDPGFLLRAILEFSHMLQWQSHADMLFAEY